MPLKSCAPGIDFLYFLYVGRSIEGAGRSVGLQFRKYRFRVCQVVHHILRITTFKSCRGFESGMLNFAPGIQAALVVVSCFVPVLNLL